MPNPRVFPDGLQVIPPGSNTPTYNVDRAGNVYSAVANIDGPAAGAITLNNAQNDVNIVFKSDTNPTHYVSDASYASGMGSHNFGNLGSNSFVYVDPPAHTAGNGNGGRMFISNTYAITIDDAKAWYSTLRLQEPNLTIGAGSVGEAQTLLITGAPTEGTKNYAVNVESGILRSKGPLQTAQGADVASGTTISFGSDGNLYPITGTTAITLITTTGWEDGSVVYLKFNSAGATLTNNATASGLTANILMGSAGTYTSRANDIVTLILVSTGTTSKSWIMASGAL